MFGICKQCLRINVKLVKVRDQRFVICEQCFHNERLARKINNES